MDRGPYKGSFLYSICQLDESIVRKAITESFSIRDLTNKLGLKLNGSTYPAFKKFAKQKSIDISHFRGKASNFGIRHKGGYDKQKILSRKSKSRTGTLRKALINSGRDLQCDLCKVGPVWLDKLLVLEVDHINGNNSDNRLENLRFLCPNCHSQTSTFRGRGKNSGIIRVSDEELKDALQKHKNIRQALLSVGLVAKGGNYSRAKKLSMLL